MSAAVASLAPPPFLGAVDWTSMSSSFSLMVTRRPHGTPIFSPAANSAV